MQQATLNQHMQQPLRFPDVTSPRFMAKRGFWLIVAGFVLPGLAQLVAGKRGLGRFGVRASIFMWVLVLVAGAGALFARGFMISLFTNSWVLLLAQILLVGYAILWVILGLDTLRLARVGKIQNNRRVVAILLSLLLTFGPAAGAAWAATTINAGRNLINNLFQNKQGVVEPIDGRYNILLLGTDAGADREGLRPDSVSLVSIDAKTGQSLIIGLPRELANMPFSASSPMHDVYPNGFGVGEGCNVGRCWLNGIYAEAEYFMPELYPDATKHASEPGIEATKDAVSGTTGLEVQFYVLINMDSFQQLIDALGGVDVNVTERLPIAGDEYGNGVEGYIEPGMQHLDGYHALWYARSRYGSANGDYDRMARQRELQSAILAQMTPQNVLTRFQDIAASGDLLAETDIPQSMLGVFSELALKAKEHQPARLELVPPTVVTEDPDFDQIRQLVREAVAGASSEPERWQADPTTTDGQ